MEKHINKYIESIQSSQGYFYSPEQVQTGTLAMDENSDNFMQMKKVTSRDISEIFTILDCSTLRIDWDKLGNWCNEMINFYREGDYTEDHMQDIELYLSILKNSKLNVKPENLIICERILKEGMVNTEVASNVLSIMYRTSLMNLDVLLHGEDEILIKNYFRDIKTMYINKYGEIKNYDSVFLVDTFCFSNISNKAGNQMSEAHTIIQILMSHQLPDSYFIPMQIMSSDILSTYYALQISKILGERLEIDDYLSDINGRIENDIVIQEKYRGAILYLMLLKEDMDKKKSNDISFHYIDLITDKVLSEDIIHNDYATALLFLKMCKLYNYQIPGEIVKSIENMASSEINNQDSIFSQLYNTCYDIQLLYLSDMENSELMNKKKDNIYRLIPDFHKLNDEEKLYALFLICETADMFSPAEQIEITGWEEVLRNCQKGDMFAFSESQAPTFVSTYYALYIENYYERNR